MTEFFLKEEEGSRLVSMHQSIETFVLLLKSLKENEWIEEYVGKTPL